VKRVLVALAVVALAAPVAHAQDSAKDHFNRGVKLYNLGHFQEAIPEFEKAYDLEPAPILLFNIAQSHRQNGNKERALFFYRRYLEQEPNASKRADVEQRMKELEQAVQQENEQKHKPPTEVSPPPPGTPGTAPAAPPPTTPPVVTAGPPTPASPIPVRLGVALGPSFLSFSGPDKVSPPVLFGFQLTGSYDFLRGPSQPSELRGGVQLQYASLPYDDVSGTGHGTSSFWGALLTLDYAYRVVDPLIIGGGIGAGVVWWAGLAQGNPFTAPNAVVSGGAIPMPSFALSARADYLVTPHIFLNFTPAFLYSKTTSDGLTTSISSVYRFDLEAGAGYRF
jgi:tetratricopeptide (TPR) repeat protein